MTMNKRAFKIWLLQHGYTQITLGEKLGIGQSTITTYNKNERYPIMFVWALRGLEQEGLNNEI